MAFEYTGVGFPWILTNGRVEMVSTRAMIKSSLLILLNWELGHRYRRLNYGSRISTLLEEPNDFVTESLVKFFIMDVIDDWEPRVEFRRIKTLKTSPTGIRVDLEYSILPADQLEILTTTINL